MGFIVGRRANRALNTRAEQRAKLEGDRISNELAEATRPQGAKARVAAAKDRAARNPPPGGMTNGVPLGSAKKPIHLPDRELHVYRDVRGRWYYKPQKLKGDYSEVTHSGVERAFERESKGREPGKRYTCRTVKDLKAQDLVVAKGFGGVFVKLSDKDPSKVLVKIGLDQPQWFDREDVRPADGIFEQAGQYFKDLEPEHPVGHKLADRAKRQWRGQAPAGKLAGKYKVVRDPAPTTPKEAEDRVRQLLTDLNDSSDSTEKKKIRARLRALGHTGGLRGG